MGNAFKEKFRFHDKVTEKEYEYNLVELMNMGQRAFNYLMDNCRLDKSPNTDEIINAVNSYYNKSGSNSFEKTSNSYFN